MKTTYLTVLLLIAAVFGITACGDKQAEPAHIETAVEHAKKHLDPTYVCPMHSSVTSDKPGNCPICGMTLVKKEVEEPVMTAQKKILYYRHPHNPSITSAKPMQDEMGMDYVPVYDDGGGASVKISAAVQNNLGVRTAKAERGKLWRRVDTVAYVDYDENKITHIHLRTRGWIEKLLIKSEGERVKKDQLLFEVYSPELVNAQEEYLQAQRSGSKTLFSASRDRMYALGISKKQVERLDATHKVEQFVQVYAPQDGIVNKLGVRQGMYVMPEVEVMSLADLSSIWLLAEVFEKQAEWIKVDQPAEVTLSYIPGRTWEGKVQYVYPSLNRTSRTLKVRLLFDNPDESLKPNMFANVNIFAGPKDDVVFVPREALIRTGSAERVILSQGDGRFAARKVVSGMESGDYIEIQYGLQEGDMVVTSGQFLIDSEANLKASLQRMSSGTEGVNQP
jgi:Cu(I)/Ag(I) efflux system membrane fusion protein